MIRKINKLNSAIAMIALALAFTTAANAVEGGASGQWQHRILLYGWFPGIDGTLNYDIPGSGSSASADASDIVENIDFVFMGLYEGRMDKWSFLTDLVYLDLSNSDDNAVSIPIGPGGGDVKVGADQSMTAWILGLYGGYNVVQTSKASLDIIAGLRYLSVDADAKLKISGPLPPELPSAKLSQSVDLLDGIIGVKGYINLTEEWYLPYRFDIGTGDSDLTWQAIVGVGYHFDWGDILLAYHHLSYDQGSSGFIQDLELSGPALGVNFRF